MTTWEYAHEWVRPRARTARVAVGNLLRKVRPYALPLTGLGCFVAAAFSVSLLAGLISAGLACFVAEWRFAK